MGRNRRPILSEEDVEYLQSDPPHENDSTERTRRSRIRSRFVVAFGALYHLDNLPKEDRELLMEWSPGDSDRFEHAGAVEVDPIGEDPFLHSTWRLDPDGPPASEQPQMRVIAHQFLKFLYLGFHDIGEPEAFETHLKAAIATAEADRLNLDPDDITVKFSVEHPVAVDVEAAKAEYERGGESELTAAELKALVDAGELEVA